MEAKNLCRWLILPKAGKTLSAIKIAIKEEVLGHIRDTKTSKEESIEHICNTFINEERRIESQC